MNMWYEYIARSERVINHLHDTQYEWHEFFDTWFANIKDELKTIGSNSGRTDERFKQFMKMYIDDRMTSFKHKMLALTFYDHVNWIWTGGKKANILIENGIVEFRIQITRRMIQARDRDVQKIADLSANKCMAETGLNAEHLILPYVIGSVPIILVKSPTIQYVIDFFIECQTNFVSTYNANTQKISMHCPTLECDIDSSESKEIHDRISQHLEALTGTETLMDILDNEQLNRGLDSHIVDFILRMQKDADALYMAQWAQIDKLVQSCTIDSFI